MTTRRLVTRRRLLAILEQWRSVRVVRIVAPGGFGKSSLCVQWASQLAALPGAQRPLTVQLLLNDVHGMLDVFLHSLASACGDELPGLRDVAALAAAGEMNSKRAATAVARIVAASERPVLLVLDDLHLAPPGPTLDMLQYLLDGDAPGLHLAFLSRTHSSLDLSELLLHGQVLSLTIDDLIFDAAEFDAFAELHQFHVLPQDQLEQIRRRSSGWAAGLQLLVQALPASRALTVDALRAAEAAPDLWKYVERALFDRAGRRISFMVETSLLPWLSADLCAAVTDTPAEDCAQLLEEISASNGLVTPKHENGEARFYVHPVLRDILQRRQMSLRPTASLDELRRRGAQALADRGDIDAALAMHGFSSSDVTAGTTTARTIDFAAVSNLLEKACRPALLRSEVAAVHRWLGHLDEAAICAHPQLAIDAAWAAYHTLDNSVHTCLLRAQKSLQENPHPRELDAELAALEALAALQAGRNADAHRMLSKALAIPYSPDGIAAGYLPSIRGYLMYGEPYSLEQRMRDFEQGYAVFTRNGYLRGQIETLVAAQWIAISFADVVGTHMSVDRAVQLLTESGMEASTFGLYSHLYAAQMLYFTDRIDDARQRLQRVLELTGDGASTNLLPYQAHVRLQLCALADSQPAALDFDPVADAIQYREAALHTSTIVSAHTALIRLLRDIRLDHPERCQDTVAIFGRTVEEIKEDDSSMLQLNVLLAAVVNGRCDDLILSRVEALRARAERFQHYSNSMLVHVVQILILQKRGRTSDAMSELRLLLRDVERTNHVRIIKDFSSLLHPTLRAVGTPFAQRMLSHDHGVQPSDVFGLSKAERHVLQHLSGRSNTMQLAAEMHVSVNTVRTHVRSIYRKLNVHSREEALSVAHGAGLLE